MEGVVFTIDNIHNKEYMINVISELMENDEEVLLRDRYRTWKANARRIRKLSIDTCKNQNGRNPTKEEILQLKSFVVKQTEKFLREKEYQEKRVRFINYLDVGMIESPIPFIWYEVTKEELIQTMKSRSYGIAYGVLKRKDKKFDSWQIFFETGEGSYENDYWGCGMFLTCKNEQIWEERVLPKIKKYMNKEIAIKILKDEGWEKYEVK